MNQRGFSLIEVMVAMLILSVGVLGVAAASGYITKLTAEGGRSGGSAAVAEARIEQLTATPCASLATTGTATTGKFTESWTVTTSSLLRTISESVTYPMGSKNRTATYIAYISCAPHSK